MRKEMTKKKSHKQTIFNFIQFWLIKSVEVFPEGFQQPGKLGWELMAEWWSGKKLNQILCLFMATTLRISLKLMLLRMGFENHSQALFSHSALSHCSDLVQISASYSLEGMCRWQSMMGVGKITCNNNSVILFYEWSWFKVTKLNQTNQFVLCIPRVPRGLWESQFQTIVTYVWSVTAFERE